MGAAPERGQVVGKRYRLESVLGEGGMAVVWRAVHTETDRQVALKLVRQEFVTDDQVRDMFVREARIASRIGRNDHIVDVLDAGLDDALGVPFLAMELLAGDPLDQRLKQRGPLDPVLATQLLTHLGEALDQAHAAGVIHRDLKPQNLFVCEDRRGKVSLKVLDFGIAKLAEHALDSSTHVGTPAYSAPEQLGGSWRTLAAQRGQEIQPVVSAQTDIWAVGLIAFEMLTASPSRLVRGAPTLAELPLKIVLEPLPSARERAGAKAGLLPPGFDAWIAQCLKLDAKQRFGSATAAVSALVRELSGLSALLRGHPAVVGHMRTAPGTQSVGPVLAAAGVAASVPGAQPAVQGMPAPSSLAASPPGPGPLPALDPTRPAAQPSAPPAAELDAWARYRQVEIRPGDARLYQDLPPLAHVPRIAHVPREVRLQGPGMIHTLAEVRVQDGLRQATGEDLMVLAIVQTERARYRASLRARRYDGSMADGLMRGVRMLDSLVAADTSGLRGGPDVDHMIAVGGAFPAEAHAALPHSLRALLIQNAFSGLLELRVGLVVMSFFDPPNRFEPAALDRLLEASTAVIQTLG